jgi:prepilin-type processing-associated H-X9-DG protein
MNCTNDKEPFSFHPGGINMAFADGGVRFTSEQIEPRSFAARITRAAGDIVVE